MADISDGLQITDKVETKGMFSLFDGLVLSESSSIASMPVTTGGILFKESVTLYSLISIEDTLRLDTSQIENRDTFLANTLLFTDFVNLTYKKDLEIGDTILIGGILSPIFNSRISIPETLKLEDNVLLYQIKPDGSYKLITLRTDTFVVNAENQAWTAYQDYNFNSYVKIDGKYYGAKEDGLYLLEGETDDGMAIPSTIRTGLMTNTIGLKSRVQEVYLYVSSNGTMTLKVLGSDNKEYMYNVVQSQDNDTLDSTRVRLGKGRKLQYWQFELNNNGSTKFDLDSVKIYHIITGQVSNT